jgi:hypothetical protein
MIEFTINSNDELAVGQVEVSPAVYLDHWALRRLSENEMLAKRMVSALQSRNGTLALSALNLAEFAKVTIGEQAENAENLVEAILPNVFFIEFDLFVVIKREDELLAGGPPTPPHADMDLLRVFAQLKPNSLNPFTACNLFKVVQKPQLAVRLDGLADTIVNRVEALRDTLDVDEDFQATIRRLPSGPQIQRGTRIVLRELVRSLLVDGQTKITRNHAIDLLHAVVPIAYCDLVLLDKYWETQVDRARSRLNKARVSAPIAKVFSGKRGGVEDFLCELESG